MASWPKAGRKRAICPTSSPAPTASLHASVVTNGFSLGNGKRSIFDRDGVALIVDQRGDDYRTQPLGNAGDRIACGVVIRTVGPAPRPKSRRNSLKRRTGSKRCPHDMIRAAMGLEKPPSTRRCAS